MSGFRPLHPLPSAGRPSGGARVQVGEAKASLLPPPAQSNLAPAPAAGFLDGVPFHPRAPARGRARWTSSPRRRPHLRFGMGPRRIKRADHRKGTPMSQRIIAVVGATGAQGGGLVRAILADPSGGFAVRALTRDPQTRQGTGAGPAWGRGRGRRRRRRGEPQAGLPGRVRRLLRHLLLGSLLAGARAGPGARHGAGRQAGRASSTSSGPPSRTPASGCRSRTTACRRCRASTRCRTSTPRARRTTTSPSWACRRRSC